MTPKPTSNDNTQCRPKSRSGSNTGASSVHKYRPMVAHCELIFTHIDTTSSPLDVDLSPRNVPSISCCQ